MAAALRRHRMRAKERPTAATAMRVFPSDRYPLPLPEGHRFPLSKYARLRARLEELAAPGAAFEFVEPHAATDDELVRVHDRAYIGRVLSGTLSDAEVRRIGFPWSRQLVERSLRSTGAAVDAAAAALADGVAGSLAGGTHHAGSDWGEGYCVFNDTAVAAREMQARGVVERVLILDCDVHQGNGTAQIFAADPTVFTMSIHGRGTFRCGRFPVHSMCRSRTASGTMTTWPPSPAPSTNPSREHGRSSCSTSPAPTRTRATASVA